MKKMSKVLFFIFCFNFILLSLGVNANAAPKEKIVSQKKTNGNSNVGKNGIKHSVEVDIYKKVMENRNFLSKANKSYAAWVNEAIGKKLMIREIKKGLENRQVIINLDKYIKYFSKKSDYKIPMEYYYDTLDEYPEIFYSETTVDCDASYDESTGEIVSYNLLVSYISDGKTIDAMKAKFNKKVEEIKNNYLSKAATDLEKEYIIHDYIIENCVYDKENYFKNTVPTIEHSAYGALVNGKAVCDGYARSAQLFFRDSNINSGIVVSESMNHAWNYVFMDGECYYLDITWDDAENNEKGVSHKYFNVTSSDLKSGATPHTWDEFENPICIGNKFNFINNNSNLKRLKDKMYYPDLASKTYFTYSTDLLGENKTLINDKDCTFKIEADKNTLYCLNFKFDKADNIIYYLYKFDPISKNKQLVFSITGTIENMYIKGQNLVIEYIQDGVKKTKTLGVSI